MKFSVPLQLFVFASSSSFARATLRGRSLQAGCPGSTVNVIFTIQNQPCNYDSLVEELTNVIANEYPNCVSDAATVLGTLLGESDVAAAKTKVQGLCASAYANTDSHFDFVDIAQKGKQFDNEFYSGGTKWNYEVQTDAGENELRQDAARVKKIFKNEAATTQINLPTDLTSFDPKQDGCDLNAAFCCWVQDRQANDNNGNCNTPYDRNCIDKDPADNANLCYVDHERSSETSHVAGGFTIFGDPKSGKENIEGSIHCHGFAWGEDPFDSSSVYKGNNLFFVSMYDHMHQRGYVRNVPGSPMCACAENMAVVTRADCTEIDAAETFEFNYFFSTATASLTLTDIDIDFNACQGADNNNNDLEAYYRRLVAEERASAANLAELQKILVGDTAGNCNQAVVDYMSEKGIIQTATA